MPTQIKVSRFPSTKTLASLTVPQDNEFQAINAAIAAIKSRFGEDPLSINFNPGEGIIAILPALRVRRTQGEELILSSEIKVTVDEKNGEKFLAFSTLSNSALMATANQLEACLRWATNKH